MQALLIVVMSVAAAVLYGIALDNVTARVCIEYFTIGHPKVIESTSPTALAFTWGVLATWWAGLPLGVILAIGARAGGAPKLGARDLLPSVGAVLAVMALLSLLAGVAGFALARMDVVFLVGDLAERVPRSRHDVYLADLWAHVASYASGFIGGAIVAIRTWRARRKST